MIVAQNVSSKGDIFGVVVTEIVIVLMSKYSKNRFRQSMSYTFRSGCFVSHGHPGLV